MKLTEINLIIIINKKTQKGDKCMIKYHDSDLGDILIDRYNYCNSYDRDKMNYYQNHVLTREEEEKTNSLRERLIEFEKKVRGVDSTDIYSYNPDHPEWRIEFFEDKGYISSVNADRDIVDIYYYGRTENEAFLNALVSHELVLCENYESYNRKKLNKDFCERFLGGEEDKEEYHGQFFFSELALQDFRKFFGDEIPKKLINYYEKHVNSLYELEFIFDFELNRFTVKEKEKLKTR